MRSVHKASRQRAAAGSVFVTIRGMRIDTDLFLAVSRSESGLIGKKGKGSLYSIAERRVPELIPVLGSQPAGDVSHKPGGRLPLLSARPAVTLATLKRAAASFAAWRREARWVWTVCLRLLPDSVAAATWTQALSPARYLATLVHFTFATGSSRSSDYGQSLKFILANIMCSRKAKKQLLRKCEKVTQKLWHFFTKK